MAGDRPDRIGVMFEGQWSRGKMFVLARTVNRGREHNRRARKVIRKFEADGAVVVFIHPEDVDGWVIYKEVEV